MTPSTEGKNSNEIGIMMLQTIMVLQTKVKQNSTLLKYEEDQLLKIAAF